jgi:hypothetical protein
MFKKLLVVCAILAVGAGVYGVAQAYFSSKSPATSSATFTAGTIDIAIESDGTNSVPFTLANWMPGQKQMVVFNVKNNSTVPVTLAGEVNGAWGNGLGDNFVYVTKAEYDNGAVWASMATTGHGTFTYADASSSSTLIEVPAGGVARIRMEATFDINATNEYQGETYTADLFVTATQVITP